MSSLLQQPSPPRTALRRLFHSFRFRLTLLFVGILALILAAFSVFIYTRQERILYAEAVERLSEQSAQLSAYYNAQLRMLAEASEGHPIQIPQGELPLLPENFVLALVGQDGKVALQQGSLPASVLAGMLSTWNGSPRILPYTLPAAQGLTGEVPYIFQVSPLLVERIWGGFLLLASPLTYAGQLQRLAISLALSSLLILLFAFAGGYWLADRAMKPVQAIVEAARSISESDLSRRLNLQREDEIGELADTFDQMLKRLEAAFERQRQFTADASHELRSPLALIELEASRLLERPHSPKEVEKALRLIQSENERMSHLVNELLLLARLDSGKVAWGAEKIDLSDIVVDVTERLSPLAREREVALRTGELVECPAQADRTYLEHLLTNLVENAIKYTQREGAEVLVETGCQELNGRAWSLVRVSDNGPGIPEEHLPQLFDRFYRLDKARTRPEGDADEQISGSGLGLAIASSIAQAYGGKIEVESKLGEGSTFTLWLP
jgi:two-component system, OmpR family, sensor kinase